MSFLRVVCAVSSLAAFCSEALSTVYLNKIWDNDTRQFYTSALIIEGTSLVLDRSYQNAYGDLNQLPPGPPFIIEAPIHIMNITDGKGNILSRGSLEFNNQYGGGGLFNPFEVIANAQPFDPNTDFLINGSFRALGSGMDPIIFRGTHRFEGGSGRVDSSDGIRFEDCVFEISLRHPPDTPFEFISPHQVAFENCEFRAGSDTLPCLIEHDDVFRPQETLRATFSMTNCHFGSRTYWGRAVVFLKDLKEVTLQNISISHQHFRTNPDLVGSLILIDNAGIRAIRDVTGSGNTIDCIRVRKCRACSASVIAGRGLPLEMVNGNIPLGCTLSIGPESIIKARDILVSGRLTVDRSILTSATDDSVGGDTDGGWPTPAGSWGLAVKEEASIVLHRTSVRYGQVATWGEALVDSCQFLHAEDAGIRIHQTAPNGVTIRNSSVRKTRRQSMIQCSGISLSASPQPLRVVLERDTVTENAGNGIDIGLGLGAAPAFISIRNSCISGNQEHGIMMTGGYAADSVLVINSNILANKGAGISSYHLYGTATGLLRLEGNSILGNGSEAGWRPGATIAIARAQIVNNSFFWNTQHGLEILPKDTNLSYIANNVFASNGGNGIRGDAPGRLLLGHNLFWNDRRGPVSYAFGNMYIGSLPQLRLLGGIYTTNGAADPLFTPSAFGQIRTVAYDASRDHTLIVTERPLDRPAVAQWAVQLDTSRVGWFLIREAHGDSILVPGDVRAYTQIGRVLQVAYPSLTRSSPAIDAGNNLFVITSTDRDGDPRIADGNGDGVAVVDIGADEFNPEEPGERVATILSPSCGDVVVAGESCTVRWSGAKTTALNLLLRIHDEIRLRIASGIPASNAEHTWAVPPDLLSTQCRIQLSDAADTTWMTVSDTFSIKPLILTRRGPGGEFERYRLLNDSWRFPNDSASMWPESWWSQFDYRGTDPFTQWPYPSFFADSAGLNARKGDFPDWPLFVKTFGTDQCYMGFLQWKLYRAEALLRWQSVKSQWNGSCLGLAASSLLSFADKPSFVSAYPEVGDFTSLYALGITDGRREVINRLWTTQMSPAFTRMRLQRRTLSPTETLAQLRRMFLSDSVNKSYLVIEHHTEEGGSGGHVVLPYCIIHNPVELQHYLIGVYENNMPGDSLQYIDIDTVARTWTYPTCGWSGTVGCYLADPIGNYARRPSLRASPLLNPLPALRKAVSEERLSCYLPSHATTRIYDSLGRVAGWPPPAGTPIPDAHPIIVLRNTPSGPLGFELPLGRYRAEVSGAADENVFVNLFSNGTIYGYTRKRLSARETDRITLASLVFIHNPDNSPRHCLVHAVAGGDSSEKAYRLACLHIAGGDSLGVTLGPGERLEVHNPGDSLRYSLQITYGTQSAGRLFTHGDIALTARTIHYVEPSWETLDTQPLRILVDLGGDGTIDDTLRLTSQLLDVSWPPSGPPERFALLQNYPNPFNASTVVSYQLNVESDVKLAVYDLLGREVAVLVNEKKTPGSHRVTFNAAGFASGVYIYRLTAGSQTQSRTMLLLK